MVLGLFAAGGYLLKESLLAKEGNSPKPPSSLHDSQTSRFNIQNSEPGSEEVIQQLALNDNQESDGDPGTNTTSTKTNTKTTARANQEANPFQHRFKCPSLDGGKGWLNTSGEITLKDLRGKVVLIDFWTYCCINCIHVLPNLKHVERKYNKELVVIGVHSAKFDNEKETENIRRAIQRYEIEHPVINDADFTIWRKFGASSWPSLFLVDPEGYIVAAGSGEIGKEALDAVVGKLVAFHKKKGTLDQTPFRFDLERSKLKKTPLKFPGKILADESGDRLFISDSNHNRIVITSLSGTLKEIVGSGAIGRKNGTFADAEFDHPQGMELIGEKLYVADTENHLLRVIDLEKKRVSTLAGTGEQSRIRTFGGSLSKTALNSPWALLHHKGILYIAMAGPHQIWSHKLGTSQIGVYAGSGREDIRNGSLETCALAQPSGLTSDGTHFYVADSEGSSIRKVPFDPKQEMTTIAGTFDLPRGRTLFEFGDVDGIRDKARLQHPLGVAFHQGIVYVADTYNHKIKKIDLKTNKVTTWLGNGKAGNSLSPVQFNEPSGLTIAHNQLFITDTNNHRICVVDLKSEKIRELTIEGLAPPVLKESESNAVVNLFHGKAKTLKAWQHRSGSDLLVQLNVELPAGFKVNQQFPVSFDIKPDDASQKIFPENVVGKPLRGTTKEKTIELKIPTTPLEGNSTITLTLNFGYCRNGVGGLCKLKSSQWTIPVISLKENAKAVLKLTEKVTKTSQK